MSELTSQHKLKMPRRHYTSKINRKDENDSTSSSDGEDTNAAMPNRKHRPRHVKQATDEVRLNPGQGTDEACFSPQQATTKETHVNTQRASSGTHIRIKSKIRVTRTSSNGNVRTHAIKYNEDFQIDKVTNSHIVIGSMTEVTWTGNDQNARNIPSYNDTPADKISKTSENSFVNEVNNSQLNQAKGTDDQLGAEDIPLNFRSEVDAENSNDSSEDSCY